MIIKILGVLDIIIGICFWVFGILGVGIQELILIMGLVLLVKGIIFIYGLSVISFSDIGVGLIILSSTSVEMPNLVVILVSLFLLQKGIFSLCG